MRQPSFSARLLFLSLSCLALRGAAEPASFDIPEQAADSALLALSAETGLEVLFPYDELHKLRTPGVSGTHEPEEALKILLQGLPYEARRIGENQYVVRSQPASLAGLRGRMLAPDGSPAAHVLVSLPDERRSATTDAHGDFAFEGLAPGSYDLVASSRDYRTVTLRDIGVRAKRTTELEPFVLRSINDPERLSPVFVEGGPSQNGRFDRGRLLPLPRTAVGNLDLHRTEDDVLPFTIYNRAQIERSGSVNLNDFLQRELLDSDAASRPPEQDGTANIFSSNSSNLMLRGYYGSDETVILVNGRRLPEMLTSGQEVRPPPPDVNFIPLSLVERVEVLPVSASALYTGNPVGGVINIVLRPDAEANELTATYTNSADRYDAPQATVSFVHGRTLLGGKLKLRLALTGTKFEPVTENEVSYIAHNQAAATASNPEQLKRATPNVRSVDGSPLVALGKSSYTSVPAGADGRGGLGAYKNRDGVLSLDLFDTPGGMANSPDSQDYAFGRRQTGMTFFGSAVYDVRPWLQLGLDGIFTRTVANRGYSVFAGSLTLDEKSSLNPFGQSVYVALNETAPALGQDYSEARMDFASLVLGALVRLPGAWNLSSDIQYGRSVTRYRGLSGVDSEKWQGLVDKGAYNPLRDTQVFGPPQAFYDEALIYYGAPWKFVKIGDYSTLDAAVRVSNTALRLPTGTSVLSLGLDYRLNHLGSYVDERSFGNGQAAQAPEYWSARTIERVSSFAELQAPLLPAHWLPSWMRRVETDVAARYVVAASSNESKIAPTGGLKIDFAGGLSLRGTVSTSNMTPPPVMSRKIVSPGTPIGGEVTLQSIYDPVLKQTYTVATSDALGAALEPESAVTRSVGLIYQRGSVHRLRASVDFVDTRKSGELTYLDASQVVNNETLLRSWVQRATSNPTTGEAIGRITHITTGVVNLADRHSQNWITSLEYDWTRCFGGTLELNARWFAFQRYDLKSAEGSRVVDELRNPDGLAPRLIPHRANFGANWTNKRFGFGVDSYFFDARKLPQTEWELQGSDRVGSYWQFDTFVQSDIGHWILPKDSRLGLRAQVRLGNIFNSAPPKYANDPSGAGVQPYGDWRRRTISLSFTASF